LSRGGALTPDDFRRGTRSSEQERRSEPRLPCSRQLTITPLCAAPRRRPITVGLFDCSGHGLGLICDEPMVVGDQFVASLELRSRVSLVVYTVRHCQRINRQFKIGAELTSFLGSPDDIANGNVLNALLTDKSANEREQHQAE
jgi:hypothetical protein